MVFLQVAALADPVDDEEGGGAAERRQHPVPGPAKVVHPLPRCGQEGAGAADIVRQRMDFGRLPAARAADGVIEGPPFAPAAERWALM